MKKKKKIRNPSAIPSKIRKAGPHKLRSEKRKKNKDKHLADEEH